MKVMVYLIWSDSKY